VGAFEAALKGWAREEFGEGKGDTAINGKALRGIHGEQLPGVRLLSKSQKESGSRARKPALWPVCGLAGSGASPEYQRLTDTCLAAYCDEAGLVLAQEGVRTEKREAELRVAPRLLERIDLHGRLVTGDALYAQRELCQQVLDGGGNFLWVVKKSQRTLYESIDLLFEEPPTGEGSGVARQTGKHGDRVEVGEIWTYSALVGYLDWPGRGRCARSSGRWFGRARREWR